MTDIIINMIMLDIEQSLNSFQNMSTDVLLFFIVEVSQITLFTHPQII